MNDYIELRNVRVNNLKNVTLNIPYNKFIVITGVSGSGNHRWHLIHYMLKGKDDMLKVCLLMPANSWGVCVNRILIISKVCLPQ